jgi:AcrR family transcriptional regulator
VYRYFPSERDLRDAVLERLEEESGVRLDGLRLEDLADVTSRILEYSAEFPIAPRAERDPTVAAANERQREALLAALKDETKGWPKSDRAIAAAMFDVLWSPVNLERLMTDWELDPKEAIRGITWVVRLVEQAIRNGERPDR